MLLGLLVSLGVITAQAKVTSPNINPQPTDIPSAIIYWADYYKVPADTLFRVANCESGLRQNRADGYPVLGQDQEIGIYQFKPRTFYGYAKEIGLENPNITSWQDQTRVASWAFSKGKQGTWTCK